MALTVETGTGAADADSYSSTSDFLNYCESIGYIYTADPETGMRRATYWIDDTFRARWPGDKLNGRDQALEWPRENAEDQAGEEIADDAVPVEVIRATWIAAIEENRATAGSFYPVVPTGLPIKREKIGPMEVEYDTAWLAPTGLSLRAVEEALSGIIGGSPSGLPSWYWA
jgi:hypothetical protein